MSHYDSKYSKKVLSHIINQSVQDFFFVDRTLVLYFGAVLDNKPSKNTWDLWIDCPWRLDDGEKIIAAYFDDAELAKPVLLKLKDATLTDIEYENVSHDLELKFSNGMRLKVFTYSTEDKQWELRGPGEYRYGIGPNLMPYEHVDEIED